MRATYDPPDVSLRYTLYPITVLVLAFQFKATLCEVAGGGFDGGGGVGEVVETPVPDRLTVSGEVRFALNSESVAEAGPETLGENQTWKVTFWFGANVYPGERSE